MERTVFVLGAGFTRAFCPTAPLMTDDYEVQKLVKKFEKFEHASRILDWELSRAAGRINIERLMTRLDGQMPYDFDQGADEELGMLLAALKKNFVRCLEVVREETVYTDELAALARHCIHDRISCITLNYDDLLDKALYEMSLTESLVGKPNWHPDSGYGFFCKPSQLSVGHAATRLDMETSMLLLKLHGSINWRPRRGFPRPYAVDAIVHHEPWSQEREHTALTNEAISLHIEPEPFLVPPVLLKSAIVEQPILRLVWYQAYKALFEATQVTFIGYSLPITDIAVSVLFYEALQTLPRTDINVVNLASSKTEKQTVRDAFQAILGHIPEEQFDFRGALNWSRDLIAGHR